MMALTPYEQIVGAGSSLVGPEVLEHDEDVDIAAVRSFVDANKQALASAREVLSGECSVPLKYEETFYETHCAGFPHLRNLARAFLLELRLARSEGDLTQAMKIGVDVLRSCCTARVRAGSTTAAPLLPRSWSMPASPICAWTLATIASTPVSLRPDRMADAIRLH